MECSKRVNYPKMGRIGRKIDPEKDYSILHGLATFDEDSTRQWNRNVEEYYDGAFSVLGVSERRHLFTIADRCEKMTHGTNPLECTIGGLAILGLAYVRQRLLEDMEVERQEVLHSPPTYDYLTPEQLAVLEAEWNESLEKISASDMIGLSPLAKIVFFDRRIGCHGWRQPE